MGIPVATQYSVPRPIRCRPPLPFPLRRRPAPSDEDYCEVVALNFMSSRRTSSILNSVVVDADLCPYFHVVTGVNSAAVGHTLFRTNTGRDVASVEWVPRGGGAYVELHNKTLEKQLVSAWLGVSRDASYRMMYAHGQTYVWVPRSQSICLYEWDPESTDDVPNLLARISNEDDIVTLEISRAAVQKRLLEMCVVCVVLFQSGCRID